VCYLTRSIRLFARRQATSLAHLAASVETTAELLSERLYHLGAWPSKNHFFCAAELCPGRGELVGDD
jgi:hypothetical protein